jgi:predicted O-methyltransferase YrrM
MLVKSLFLLVASMMSFELHANIPFALQETNEVDELKQHVHRILPSLEGWCSKEKASHFIDLILESKPKTWVEIGVFGGSSIFPVASTLKLLGEGVIIGIDPWEKGECIKYLDSPEDLINHDWWSKVNLDYVYDSYLNMLKKYELSDYCITMKTTSEQAAKAIGAIDVLHIDGNHSKEASTQDVQLFLPKVRSGGYVWMDDCLWNGTQNAFNLLSQSCDVITSVDNGNCTLFKKR